MPGILIVAERTKGQLEDSAFELATLARQLGGPVASALLGSGVAGPAGELAAWCDDVFVFDHPRLDAPDGMATADLLLPLIGEVKPSVVLVPHTNTGMDLAPALSVRAGMPLLADCIALEMRGDVLAGVRAPYGGKVHERVATRPSGRGHMATVRPGAFPAPGTPPGAGGKIDVRAVPGAGDARRRFVETVAPEAGQVDIGEAELLVAVGRGIDDAENIEMMRSLAEALGAELSCTRPVVDKGWLPKARQVGTSGVSVKPKAYLAFGVSGSFQHMGGVRGKPFLVAVNKDRGAPIFGVADVGIVGDLHEIVPLLTEKIREAKG